MRVRGSLAPLLALLLVSAVGCSSNGGDVTATLDDYTISLSETELSAGEHTFDVQNDAGQTHEFVIVSTDLAEDQLPTDEAGDVDEEGEGIEPVDEVEDVEAGSSQSLTVTLESGNYVVLCNLPGHYRQGMHGTLTVS
ncbi:MAG TPA: plastocyanin/azurin family copper-binding protein [Actinomycetota bacterium]